MKGMGIGSSIALVDVALRSIDEKDLCDDLISMIQRDGFLLCVLDFAVSKQKNQGNILCYKKVWLRSNVIELSWF